MARRASDDAVGLRPLSAQRFFEREARLRDEPAREIEDASRADDDA